jgi:hypothetical protein
MYNIAPLYSTLYDDAIPPVGFDLSLCRDEDMIGWKKALIIGANFGIIGYEYVIVKLKIPKDATVLFTPRKCRSNRAIVLGFYPCLYHGEELSKLDITSAMSWYDQSFTYNLGEEITPDYFDCDWRKTCSHGINFFRNFDEAVNYVF